MTYPPDQRDCRACPARAGCSRPVLGRGRRDAEILVLGEAPDGYSDLRGEAFEPIQGEGQRLQWLLDQVGADRAEVRVSYSVGCHIPPGADGQFRAPERAWVTACRHWVAQELSACLAAYEARYPHAGYCPALITLGIRPLFAVMGPDLRHPETYLGHWIASPLFPQLGDSIFALPAFYTLREEVRTAAIEVEWATALAQLGRGLGLLEKRIETVTEQDFERLPACTGRSKNVTPCKCDAMRVRWRQQQHAAAHPRDEKRYTGALRGPQFGTLEDP